MSLITSRHHPIVKTCRDLARGRGDALLLDGWHLLAEALRAGLEITTIAYCDEAEVAHDALLDAARRTPARLLHVSAAVMQALSPVRAPTGAVTIAHRPMVDHGRLVEPAPALALATIGLQDPGNVGAAIRSAAAAGATGVIADAAGADPWGWKALRAAMGSTFTIPVLREPALPDRLHAWRVAGLQVVAAVPRDGVPFTEHDFTAPAVIVLGGEGAGLPDAVLARASSRVAIPMRTGVESLNAAVAAALLLYEARRQRTRRGPR